VLIIGLITAFGCLIDWRAAMLNPAYVLGIAMWAPRSFTDICHCAARRDICPE
jgi:hypothetical protein